MRNLLKSALLASAFGLITAGGANAHIVITNMNQPSTWEGAVLTLLVPHGCGPEPTTEVRIKVPDNVNMMLPEPKAGWTVTITKRKLETPKKVGNREVSEVLDEVVWSGNSLPSDNAGLFTFVTNFSNKPGERVFFKTVQKCGSVEDRWIDTVGDDEDIWRIWLKPKPSPFVVLKEPEAPQLFAPFETIMAARKEEMAKGKK